MVVIDPDGSQHLSQDYSDDWLVASDSNATQFIAVTLSVFIRPSRL